jgi:hypothetical protein
MLKKEEVFHFWGKGEGRKENDFEVRNAGPSSNNLQSRLSHFGFILDRV